MPPYNAHTSLLSCSTFLCTGWANACYLCSRPCTVGRLAAISVCHEPPAPQRFTHPLSSALEHSSVPLQQHAQHYAVIRGASPLRHHPSAFHSAHKPGRHVAATPSLEIRPLPSFVPGQLVLPIAAFGAGGGSPPSFTRQPFSVIPLIHSSAHPPPDFNLTTTRHSPPPTAPSPPPAPSPCCWNASSPNHWHMMPCTS